MRKLLLASLAAALLLSGVAVADDHAAAEQATPKVEPLLVKVDAQGKVVSMLPAYKLPASLEQTLRTTVEGMVKKPAVDKDGHPIPSQFIMNMAMQVQPGANGTNSVQFTVASIKQVPDGSWYWVRTPDHRMALANSANTFRGASEHVLPDNPMGNSSGAPPRTPPPQGH